MDQPQGGHGAWRDDGSAFVVVRTYGDVPTAEVDRGLLASHGIPAVLEDAHMALVDGLLTTAIGGVKLRVPAGERERAVRLLAGDADLAFSDDDAERCPGCGADAVMVVRPYAAFALLTLVFPLLVVLLPIALPLALIRRQACAACRHQWRATPRRPATRPPH